MKPSRPDENALVDLVDLLLYKGAVVEADVLITVADIPLVGLKLRAALAGMETMVEYGIFEEWDERQRERGRRVSGGPVKTARLTTSPGERNGNGSELESEPDGQ